MSVADFFTHRLHRWWRAVCASPAESYLAQAVDRADLEFRLRQIDHHAAPYQRHSAAFGQFRGLSGR